MLNLSRWNRDRAVVARALPFFVRRRAAAAVAAALLVPGGSLFAADWTGAADGDWSNAANWDPASTPTFVTPVLIDTDASHAPVIDGHAASASTVTVGDTADASLTIRGGGTLTHSGLATIGDDDGAAGHVTVSGPGSAWSITGESIYLGNQGAGSLTISDGAAVSNTYSVIGRLAGSSGFATVTGPGSSWTASQSLTVGGGGFGSLTVTDGAAVTSERQGAVGGSATGIMSVSGPGSSWTHAGYVYVGQAANGTLSITDAGRVGISTYLHMGLWPEANGNIFVANPGSRLDVGGELLIGLTGSAALTITDEALVTLGGGLTFNEQDSADGVLRLDRGYLAWLGDHEAAIQSMIDAGLLQVMTPSGWASAAGGNAVTFEYFASASDADAAAFTGGRYADLGGYTLVTAIPEPASVALLALTAPALLRRRRPGGGEKGAGGL